MPFAQIVRFFFQVASRMSREDRITFSDQVYMRLPDVEITLVSLGMEIQTTRLSIDDAKEIFKSIKSACDMHEIKEIKVGELYWKTDGRLQSADEDRMVIEFGEPLGFARHVVNRQDVSSAVIEFTKRFGLSQ